MFRLSEIFKVLKHEDVVVLGVEHDTRRIKKGYLYVAIKGENLDGHNFIKEAEQKGAVACIVERKVDGVAIPQIIVGDTVKAYGEMAIFWRKKIKYPVIALTGSNGKTTTRDMIAAILSYRHKVVRSDSNFNNLIGVPYTLLNFPLDADYAVVELGMNMKGEIARLSEITDPDVGLITNIGRAHVGKLGSMDAVTSAKLELFDYMMKKKSTFIVNMSDPRIRSWFEKNRPVKYVPFVDVEGLGSDDEKQKFIIKLKDGRSETGYVKLLGPHNLQNVAASVSVAVYLGMDMKDCVKALEKFIPPKMRSNIVVKNGVEFIIDCYNANPDSMRAAIETCAGIKGRKRHIAVIGDMKELDGMEQELHFEIGSFLAEEKYDLVFAIGEHSKEYEKGFITRSPASNIKTYELKDMALLKKDIGSYVKDGDVVLVKASRVIELEKIFE